MVARNDEHDHGEGQVCEGCRFKSALADHLEYAAEEGGEDWVHTTGEIVELMGTASAALARLWNAQFDDDASDPADSANEAAAAISRLGGAIEELWHALMDDEQGTSP
jgi:hypothetical protein